MSKDFVKQIKKYICLGMATMTLMGIANPQAVQAAELDELLKEGNVGPAPVVTYNFEKSFSDVPSYWATDSIAWGLKNNFIQGYEDGTFRPNAQLTESEFCTMLARFVKNTNKDKIKQIIPDRHWSQAYYNEIALYGLPFKGYNDDVVKDTSVTRGRIAQIVAAKNGFNLSEEQAIYYMYENDLSAGNVPNQMTLDSYGKDDPLQRDQAITFLRRLSEKGYTTFKGKPSIAGNAKGDEIIGTVGVEPSTDKVDFKDFIGKSGAFDYDNYMNSVVDGDTALNDKSFREKHVTDPHTVAKVNGIVTPWSGDTAFVKNESIIITTLHNTNSRLGFREKDPFLKVINDNWGSYLTQYQLDKVVEFTNNNYTVLGNKGDISWGILGDKYDVVVTKMISGDIEVGIYYKNIISEPITRIINK